MDKVIIEGRQTLGKPGVDLDTRVRRQFAPTCRSRPSMLAGAEALTGARVQCRVAQLNEETGSSYFFSSLGRTRSCRFRPSYAARHPQIMSCPCRIAPWRSFLHGLAQVHKLEASSSSFRLSTVALRPALYRHDPRTKSWAAARHFHASRVVRSDGEAAAKAFEKEAPREPHSISPDQSSAERNESAPPGDAETDRFWKSRRDDGTLPWNDPPPPPDKGDKQKQSQGSKKGKTDKSKPEQKEDSSAGPNPPPAKPRELWMLQKEALKKKFPDGWQPRKKLSPDALAGIRALNGQFPEVYTTKALADKFEMSPEAIRRILRSRWQPSEEEDRKRHERWVARGKSIWERKASLGIKPPRKWRDEGVARDPGYHDWRKKVAKREKAWEDEEVRRYRGQRAAQKSPSFGKGQ